MAALPLPPSDSIDALLEGFEFSTTVPPASSVVVAVASTNKRSYNDINESNNNNSSELKKFARTNNSSNNHTTTTTAATTTPANEHKAVMGSLNESKRTSSIHDGTTMNSSGVGGAVISSIPSFTAAKAARHADIEAARLSKRGSGRNVIPTAAASSSTAGQWTANNDDLNVASVETPSPRSSSPSLARSESIRAKRPRIPGPAGQLDDDNHAADGTDVKTLIIANNSHLPLRTDRDEHLFRSGAWLQMLQSLDEGIDLAHCYINPRNVMNGGGRSHFAYNLDYVRREGYKKKVLSLIVAVKSTTNIEADASAVFRDPFGQMDGAIHRNVFDRYPQQVGVGAVLVLQRVSVFSPTPTLHYLNVTSDNICRVFPLRTSFPPGFTIPIIPRLLAPVPQPFSTLSPSPPPSPSVSPQALSSSSQPPVLPLSSASSSSLSSPVATPTTSSAAAAAAANRRAMLLARVKPDPTITTTIATSRTTEQSSLQTVHVRPPSSTTVVAAKPHVPTIPVILPSTTTAPKAVVPPPAAAAAATTADIDALLEGMEF